MFRLFFSGSPLVQQTQIRLPSNRNNAPENAPVLYGYICETERRDRRPHFAAVDPTRGHRVLYALDDFGEGCAGEEGLHAEEVGVEEGREEGLVYNYLHVAVSECDPREFCEDVAYLCRKRQYLTPVVEVIPQP